ncbi:MAG: ribosomal protein bacterial [Bacteroidetes bacterium]|nr:ribosomal protein bacterial [Bacteroidota bacterium]
MKAIIGKKVGMTSIFADGKYVGVTVIDVQGNVVTQVKTQDIDGYTAIQVGFDDKTEKAANNAEKGHAKKANSVPKRKYVEFRDYDFEKKIGELITAETFAEGEKVAVVGVSKGKGFQGVVKRHGFSGVGMASHGQHDRARAPGSLGASSDPSRVFKGMRMAGRMGGNRIKTQNVKIVKIMADKNLILLGGSVPGAIGGYVVLERN